MWFGQGVTLKPLFDSYIKAKTEYLSVDQDTAVNLLRLANIEMQKALLKYPYTDDEDEKYNPDHEAKFDDVMMGVYEKTYYYLRTEFPDLEVWTRDKSLLLKLESMTTFTKQQQAAFLALAEKYDKNVFALLSKQQGAISVNNAEDAALLENFSGKVCDWVLKDHPDYDGKDEDINADAEMVSFMIADILADAGY